ncbi:MAG: DegT/DnrJ/EryC1/StrS family aminotransferase, partial [Hyphomicrobiales bacterium]|nr:DegT/DnrJ/EryC1/StrS family aminotransferase [Hyphomicrobiales bacterium]
AEINAAKAVLDSGFMTMGERCRAFEAEFAEYFGAEHAVMVNSGSSANLLALFALADPLLKPDQGYKRLKPGAEIIVPALSWATTVWPVLQAGAIPVFVDCDPQTLQVSPDAVEAAITPDTAAIVLVHVLGGAVDSKSIADIAKRHGLWLFEDSCEALGVKLNGKHVGTFGDMGSFSFYFSHHITTIEGGMVVTNNDGLADLLRSLRAHGWVRDMKGGDTIARQHTDIDRRFLFATAGFNVRPTEINAAIGSEQLKRLDGFNETRRSIARRFDEGLNDLQQQGNLQLVSYDNRVLPAPFGYTVICKSAEHRNGLNAHLLDRGIETRPVICGNMTRQPVLAHYKHRVSGTLAGADRVMDCGLYWGTHPFMEAADIDYVIDAVQEYFR